MSSHSTPRVFVSHSSADQLFGKRLVQDLRHALGDDAAVWYDTLGGLRGGIAWWREIVQEVTACDVFIVILSPEAVKSPWVNDEMTLAWSQKNSEKGKCIIPLLYRPCEVRGDFATLNAVSFLPPKAYDAAFEELLARLGVQPTSRSAQKSRVSRRVIVGSLLAGLALSGSGAAWFTLSSKAQPGTALVYRGHSDAVTTVSWAPNPAYIASGSKDRTVQVWDASTGKTLYTYNGYSGTVWSVTWLPREERILSGGEDNNFRTAQIWDAFSGGNAEIFYPGEPSALTVACSPDAASVAFGDGKSVDIWYVIPQGPSLSYSGHTGTVTGLAWSPDGKQLASASADKTVQVWKAASGKLIFTYKGHTGIVTGIAWSPDGKRLASTSADKTVQVWDAGSGHWLYTYHGHTGATNTVAWSPDGKRLASASADKTVQVWDATSGKPIFTYKGHADAITAVAWSPNGKRLASASTDKTVQVWQAH